MVNDNVLRNKKNDKYDGSHRRSGFKRFEANLQSFYHSVEQQNWKDAKGIGENILKMETSDFSTTEMDEYNRHFNRVRNAVRSMPEVQ